MPNTATFTIPSRIEIAASVAMTAAPANPDAISSESSTPAPVEA